MSELKIKWRRLVSKDETCPRCAFTEKELDKAVENLRGSLSVLGIDVLLEKEEISQEDFKKNPLHSNQIWINNRLLENWIGADTGQSECCDICGPAECRTVDDGENEYETIPSELIIKAALVATSEITASNNKKSCCNSTGHNSSCC